MPENFKKELPKLLAYLKDRKSTLTDDCARGPYFSGVLSRYFEAVASQHAEPISADLLAAIHAEAAARHNDCRPGCRHMAELCKSHMTEAVRPLVLENRAADIARDIFPRAQYT